MPAFDAATNAAHSACLRFSSLSVSARRFGQFQQGRQLPGSTLDVGGLNSTNSRGHIETLGFAEELMDEACSATLLRHSLVSSESGLGER